MYGESLEFTFINTLGNFGLLKSGTCYLLYSICSSYMCIYYLHHGSSITKLALSLFSHSPILMNMMFHGLLSLPCFSIGILLILFYINQGEPILNGGYEFLCETAHMQGIISSQVELFHNTTILGKHLLMYKSFL